MKHYLPFLASIAILFACASQEVEVDPAQSQVHYELGMELAKHALYQNALEEFALAIKFDPDNLKAYRKKGLIHFGLKQYDKAEMFFKKPIDMIRILEECRNLIENPEFEEISPPTSP